MCVKINKMVPSGPRKKLRYELQTTVKCLEVGKQRGCQMSQGVIFTEDRNWMFTESCFIGHEVWATWLTGQLTEDALVTMWSRLKTALSRFLSSFIFGADPQRAPLRESAAVYVRSSAVPYRAFVLPGIWGPDQTCAERLFKLYNPFAYLYVT